MSKVWHPDKMSVHTFSIIANVHVDDILLPEDSSAELAAVVDTFYKGSAKLLRNIYASNNFITGIAVYSIPGRKIGGGDRSQKEELDRAAFLEFIKDRAVIDDEGGG